jgi:hypothetical protein
MLAFEHQEDRAPTHGYEPTREACDEGRQAAADVRFAPKADAIADIGECLKSAGWRTSGPRNSRNGSYGMSARQRMSLSPA